MDQARALPALLDAKSAALDALRLEPGHCVVDVGCGPGEDCLAMVPHVVPGGTVIGIDRSEAMVAEGRRRAAARSALVTCQPGDAVKLPLPDATADACRADNLLQHLVDPGAAVAEMVRITRPGGRISLLEFDQATTVIDHLDRSTTALIIDSMVAATAQGWAGRTLRRRLRAAGCEDVTVQARFVDANRPFLATLVAPALARLASNGTPPDVLDAWTADLDAAWDAGHLTAGAVVFVAAGTVSPAAQPSRPSASA